MIIVLIYQNLTPKEFEMEKLIFEKILAKVGQSKSKSTWTAQLDFQNTKYTNRITK